MVREPRWTGEKDVKTGELSSFRESCPRIQKMLHAKAKEAPSFRSYSLSDNAHGVRTCSVWPGRKTARNGGSAGLAKSLKSVFCIYSYGVEKWLGETGAGPGLHPLFSALCGHAQVLLAKKQRGKFRTLGIPCVPIRCRKRRHFLECCAPIFRPGRTGPGTLSPIPRSPNPGKIPSSSCIGWSEHRLHRDRLATPTVRSYFGLPVASSLNSMKSVSPPQQCWAGVGLDQGVAGDGGRGRRRARRRRRLRPGSSDDSRHRIRQGAPRCTPLIHPR